MAPLASAAELAGPQQPQFGCYHNFRWRAQRIFPNAFNPNVTPL